MRTAIDQIDSTIDVITPENISFEYQLAGPFRRLPAFLTDLAIRFTIISLVQIVSMISGLGSSMIVSPLTILTWFVIEWFYGGLLETYWNGQTVGKRLMGIRVLQIDGQPINGLQAVMRNILRGIDLMPLFPLGAIAAGADPTGMMIPTGILGIASAVLTQRYQRLGDLACGTMVVVEEQRRLAGTVKGIDAPVREVVDLIPTNYVVSRKVSNALAAYAERRRFLSGPRIREIAKHLGQPLTDRMGIKVPNDNYDTLLCALYYRTFVTGAGNDLNSDVAGAQVSAGAAVATPEEPARGSTPSGPRGATR